MRPIALAAFALIALAACSPKPDSAAAAETTAAAAATEAHAGHDMSSQGAMPMDHDMAKSDAADDAPATLTPDNHTFHTYPGKFETVRLSDTEGGHWSVKGDLPANLALTGTGMEELPDGSRAFAARYEMKASGNATLVFERRGSENASDPVLEMRTINFMVH